MAKLTMPLAEFLIGAAGGDEDETGKILPEAAVMRLTERAADLAAGLRFKKDDWVTPRPDTAIRGRGEPHLVIEVRPDAPPDWGAENGSPQYGSTLDMRVLCFSHGVIVAYWVESSHYEPWRLPA